MWTIIRFSLSGGDAARYRAAFALLRRAGFREHQGADSPRAGEAFAAAAVGDVEGDPSVVARAIFERLAEARLSPVMVSGARVRAAPRGAPVPLASA
jgi:hypothetical protein